MPTKRSSPAQPPPDLPTGRLILSGLTAFGYHGNKPAERKLGQTFTADLEVTIDSRKAAATDRIEDTISYPLLEKTARKILEGEPAAGFHVAQVTARPAEIAEAGAQRHSGEPVRGVTARSGPTRSDGAGATWTSAQLPALATIG